MPSLATVDPLISVVSYFSLCCHILSRASHVHGCLFFFVRWRIAGYTSNDVQTSRRANTDKPANTAMPENTAMLMFQTSCETGMHI